MKERILIVLLIAVFVAIIALMVYETAYGEDGLYILCDPRPGRMVNVRSRPTTSARVVAWVECGQYVQTDGQEKRGFVHVVNLPAEEDAGWIFAGYLVDEAPRIRTYTAEVWEGDVVARSSVNGRRLRKLREGRTVTVYAQTNRWAVTNRGFIMCDWLKEVD